MTIPNLLSLFRLLLVPVFPLVFFQSWPNARQWAVLIYLVAFLTDIADGWIARRFNQITPLWTVAVFFCKELAMAIGSLAMYHKLGDVISANWLGKAATGVFFVVCVLLVLFPAIPRPWATGLISVALAMTIAAFLSYLFQYMKLLR